MINDFMGNAKIDPMASRNFQLEETNGYLTFQYTNQEFSAMVKNINKKYRSHTSINTSLPQNNNSEKNVFRVILIFNLKKYDL